MLELIVRQTVSKNVRWTSIGLLDESKESLGVVSTYELSNYTKTIIRIFTHTSYSKHSVLLSSIADTLMMALTPDLNLSGLSDTLITNHPEQRVLVV
jgi:Ni,Fe-hydrogenase III component G